MTTKTKPNLLAQFAEEPLEAEGFKWRNVFFHHNHPAYYSPRVGDDRSERAQLAQETLSKLRRYGGEHDAASDINNPDIPIIFNDCYLVIQIPVKED